VRVRGTVGEHVLHKRYSCFAALRRSLMQDASFVSSAGSLPPMPAKSFFGTRFFYTAPRLMEERERGFRRLLRAVSLADPSAEHAAWREFLCLPPLLNHESHVTLSSDALDSALKFIVELSNEDLTS